MNNFLPRFLDWYLLVLHGDPTSYDRWKWLKRYLQPGALRTLDAGCGSGTFTMYAARLGNRAVGISFDEQNYKKASMRADALGIKNAEFIVGDLRELDRLNSKIGIFDQIICFETIEHILNDRKLIVDLASALKPKGRLLLTTPYKHYIPLLGDHISEYEDGGHVRWGYTFDEMRALFNDAGIEMVAEEYISGFVSQKITNLVRRLAAYLPYPIVWSITLPLRIFQIADRSLRRLLRYPYLSIGVFGIKR